jgi:hypothetical protein
VRREGQQPDIHRRRQGQPRASHISSSNPSRGIHPAVRVSFSPCPSVRLPASRLCSGWRASSTLSSFSPSKKKKKEKTGRQVDGSFLPSYIPISLWSDFHPPRSNQAKPLRAPKPRKTRPSTTATTAETTAAIGRRVRSLALVIRQTDTHRQRKTSAIGTKTDASR